MPLAQLSSSFPIQLGPLRENSKSVALDVPDPIQNEHKIYSNLICRHRKGKEMMIKYICKGLSIRSSTAWISRRQDIKEYGAVWW